MAHIVSLVVDVRERELLRHIGTWPRVTNGGLINIGDIHVNIDGELYMMIERKTAADFAASITDGRYHDQKRRMLDNAPRVMYLLEGLFDVRCPEVFRNGIKRTTLFSASESAMMGDGIFVAHTENMQGTVAFLRRLMTRTGALMHPELQAARAGKTPAMAEAPSGVRYALYGGVHAEKKANLNAESGFIRMLAQIPKISAVKAEAIRQKFGNVATLCAAITETESADVLHAVLTETARAATCKTVLAPIADIVVPSPKGDRRIGPAAARNVVAFLIGDSAASVVPSESADTIPAKKRRRKLTPVATE